MGRLKKKLRTTTASSPRDEGSVHDRRAKDFALNVDVAVIDVDDPYAIKAGDKITVLRQLRGDPLARLHSHSQIDRVQYEAGRRYQRDWEIVEQGAQAIDPSKEKVDGGRLAEPLPERRLAASERLSAAHAQLGLHAKKLVYAFLIEEQNLERLSISTFNRMGERWSNYYGRMLRDALDILAVEYKLAGRL